MNSDNGKIGFSIELDNSQLNRDIKKSQQAFRDLGDQVESECSRMDNAFSGISRSVASIGAAWSLQELGKNVATIRGEFQSLQKTMEVMLQSKSKAEALMAQMVQTAATTPFGLQEVAGGAKQLIAYGLEADKVNDTLIQLGNIASGLKIPLSDLIYLYGTTMAQGRLYAQDLNQFTGRGIPMIKELAEHFGVAESKVKGLVEEGKVGFPEVQAVINDLTGEGGKFFNLMAEQSTLINGKISNLEDAFDSMFNKIGQSNEGIINDTIDTALLLVENYELVGDVLMTLVADYGVYKATLMAVTAYTNACYNFEIAQLKTVVAEKGAEIDADLASAVSKGRMTAQRAAEVQALRQEIAAKIEAATVTERVAQAELAQATMKYESFQVTVSLSKMRVAQAQQELAAAQASGDATAIESAKTNLNTAIKERNNVARQSSILKRNLETASTNANAASQAKATLVTKADTAAKKIQATTTSLLTLCTNGLSKAFKALTAAMAKNPFGLILVAVTTVLGALITMNDAIEETSEEVERFGESAVKTTRNVNLLLTVINNTSADSKVHKDAVNELAGIYEEFGVKIDDEISKLQQLNEKREEVIALIQKEGAERQKANLAAQITKQYNDEMQEAKSDLIENLEKTWAGDLLGLTAKHKELKANAKFIASTIEAVVGDNLSLIVGKSGDAYIEGIGQIKDKIVKALKEFGISEKTVLDEFARGAITDTGWTSYIEEAREATETLNAEYERLERFIDANTESHEKEAEAIDYTTMSFDELFDAAYKAKEKVAEVGTVEAKPAVNTSSIDNAISRTETLLGNIELLGGMQMPNWSWSNFSTPTTPTEYLGPYRPGYTPALPTLPSVSETTTTTDNSQQQALNELDRRIVEAIKTRKGTSDLLKEVNSALETAEAGSDDERRLLAIQRRLQNQQKKFKTSSGTGETPAQRRANIEKAEQETENLLLQSSQQRQEMERNLHFQEEQNRINLERDASKRKRAQLKLDHEKELAQLEQQKQAAIKAEIQRQKAIFDAQENEKKVANKDYVKRNFTEANIDQSQIATIEAQYATLTEQTKQLHKQSEAEMWRSEFESMRDYLKDYGTFQQQKLAIAEEYAEKIRNASSEGERLSLERERDSKLSSVEANALKANIDWTAVFGEFGGMFAEVTRPILEDAKKYIQTDEFRNADHASQQALIEAIQQMEQSMGGTDKVNFEKLGNDVKAYQKAMLELRTAQNEYQGTFNHLIDAQNTYEEAVRSGTEEEQAAAAEALRIAQENEVAASQNIQTLQSTATEAQNVMVQTANTLKQSMDGVVSGLQKMASGSLSGAFEGFKELSDSASKISGKIGEAFSKVSETLKDIPIVGWIIAIIDIFKDGASVVIEGIIDAVFGAISGILNDVLSGDLVVTIVKSIGNGLKNIFDAITFGGFSSWFGFGGNAKEVAETINRLTERNELLQTAIEDLTEEIKDSKGSKSVEAYKEAVKLQEETNQNYLNIAKAQAGYSGSHHSWNYYWGGFTEEQIKKFSKQIGRSWNGNIWSLTPEEMKMLRENVDMWTRIQNTGKGGYGGRLTERLNDYIAQADKLEELKNNLYEGLTGISFESMYDSFVDSLMDMEYSAEDAANNISEYFTRAMLSNKIGELMSDRLEKWWTDFGKAMEDGTLDKEERDELHNSYMGYVEEAQKIRDDVFAATGYSNNSSSQDSTKKGFATASQDGVEELNGRFTAVQMDTSAIRELMLQYGVDMTSLRLSASDIRQHTDEIRNLSLTAIDHLETISKNTHELFEINERLGKIEKNTRNL